MRVTRTLGVVGLEGADNWVMRAWYVGVGWVCVHPYTFVVVAHMDVRSAYRILQCTVFNSSPSLGGGVL